MRGGQGAKVKTGGQFQGYYSGPGKRGWLVVLKITVELKMKRIGEIFLRGKLIELTDRLNMWIRKRRT